MILISNHGMHSNLRVWLCSLSAGDFSAKVSTYGATWVSFCMPNRSGVSGDVLLGFDTLEGYVGSRAYHGATIGRYANRIAGGRFLLDGVPYLIPSNDNRGNAIHGGPEGFGCRVWHLVGYGSGSDFDWVRMSLDSADGDMGFPGLMHLDVEFRLSSSGSFSFAWEAVCTKRCPVSITNHAYFNLDVTGDVLNHVVCLDSDWFLPVDFVSMIPTGKLSAVAGTALDFTSPKTLGRDIGLLLDGYDHCFLVRTGSEGEDPVDDSTGLRKLAIMYAPLSGRALSIMTTLPAVQLYTGNHLDGTEQGRSAVPYGMHAGVCLETGFPPDAMNHFGFPFCILNPGVLCRNETEYRFSVN